MQTGPLPHLQRPLAHGLAAADVFGRPWMCDGAATGGAGPPTKETIMNHTGYSLRLPERSLFSELTSGGRRLEDALDDWLSANPDDEVLQHVYGWTDASEREAL